MFNTGQLSKQILPKLRPLGVKLLFISIGTGARAKEFCKETGLPEENVFADPENKCYDALGFYKVGPASLQAKPLSIVLLFHK